MRRTFLSSLVVAGVSVSPAMSFAGAKSRKVDKRLLGTWKSDKEKTVKNWRYKKPIDDETRERFESIFGKLTWRITETHVHGEFEDQKFSDCYTVLASDEKSVVVVHRNSEKPELKQYFFEEDYLYVLASGYNLEFFKRIAA